MKRPVPAVPQAELDLLATVAQGDTGQSRTSRDLLFLLVGAKDLSGFAGEGLLEIRTLDRKLTDAFLKIADWWRVPTKNDQPLYVIFADVENRFASRRQKPPRYTQPEDDLRLLLQRLKLELPEQAPRGSKLLQPQPRMPMWCRLFESLS